jgi:hypothetical protein
MAGGSAGFASAADPFIFVTNCLESPGNGAFSGMIQKIGLKKPFFQRKLLTRCCLIHRRAVFNAMASFEYGV